MSKFRVILFLFTMFVAKLSLAATYYCATDGLDSRTTAQAQNIATPWRTIDSSESKMNDGDTLIVRGGNYYESISTTDSGSSGSHITIQAYAGETAIVDGGTVITGWTQCADACDFLTPAGVDIETAGFAGNANFANIYKATYTSSQAARTDYVHMVEDDTFLFVSSDPDQTRYTYNRDDEFRNVSSDSYSQATYVYDTTLDKPDGYYVGATLQIYVKANANTVSTKKVTAWDNTLKRFSLNSVLSYNLQSGDRYAIQNHWSVLNKEAETYHTTTAVGGVYTAYIWPRDAADLTAKIKFCTRPYGVYLSYGQYLTYENLIFQNFAPSSATQPYNGGGIIKPYTTAPSAEVVREVWVRGCTLRNMVCSTSGAAISFICPRACEVNDCNVLDVRDGFGVQFAKNSLRGNSSKIVNSYFDRIEETSVKPTGNDQLEISHNRIGEAATHGNAFSSYTLNHQILFAHNYVTRANNAVATHDTNNIYVFGNVLEADDESGSLNVWAYASDNMEGDIYILHNTVINANSDTAISINDSLAPTNDPCLVIINNIADGLVIYSAWYPVMTHTYNLYLDKSSYQNNQAQTGDWDNSWALGTGESFVDEGYALTFVNYTVYDYNLIADSCAVSVGGDITAYTTKMNTIWPNYDFTKDLAGTTWASPRSIGAYETTGVPVADTTDPLPEPMTFTSAPAAVDSTQITMTATTATDASGVEYIFLCTAGGGHNSTQDSPIYVDTLLTANTQYTYTVQARDKSTNQNTNTVSGAASATTDALPDETPPTPSQMSFSTPPYVVNTYTVSMTAETATDDAGVEYRFLETTGNTNGTSSGWQDSGSYTDSDLSANTLYTYTVQARDKSSNNNTNTVSDPCSITTPHETEPEKDVHWIDTFFEWWGW